MYKMNFEGVLSKVIKRLTRQLTFSKWSNFVAPAVKEFEDLSLFFTVLNCFPSCFCK